MTSHKFSGQTASSNTATDHNNSTGFLMLKRLFLAGLLSLVSVSAFAAGTIPFSLSQQFDSLGKPLANCFFYTIQAGTTSTPQTAYQDSALTLALPNPMRCDAAGRLPQFYLADGLIKVRITDKNGVAQAYPNGANGIDNIQVIGPSGGGGGGGTVDPTTILATGDMKVAYGTGILSGFVRANGRTIGSSTSGATERANADCSALFQYLWGADANLAVSGGRGASAAADWAANKTITLPDIRGRTLAGLDDMGNTAAGRLTATYFGTAATVLGAAGGGESQTLTASQLAPHRHAVTLTDPGHSHTSNAAIGPAANTTPNGAGAGGTINAAAVFATINSATTGISIHAFDSTSNATDLAGSGAPHNIVQPTMLASIYIKL
jgi:microcystin-dependent protein